ncbi:MAG: cadherin-like domain-containing protein [Syntrophomonadaceae bacterium]|jgi:hypothetical protein|nr:cadherin-like domain-containing protein [Syntrophomonadaceae bacterium]
MRKTTLFIGIMTLACLVCAGFLVADSTGVAVAQNSVNDVVYLAVYDDNYSVQRDKVLEVEAPGVLVNDLCTDTAVVKAVYGPFHGALVLNDNGSFKYTPDKGYTGTDFFDYQVTDNDADGTYRDTGQVNINVYKRSGGSSSSTSTEDKDQDKKDTKDTGAQNGSDDATEVTGPGQDAGDNSSTQDRTTGQQIEEAVPSPSEELPNTGMGQDCLIALALIFIFTGAAAAYSSKQASRNDD